MVVFDLRIGDFRGTLVEQTGAHHDDGVLRIYLDKFADVGWASYEGSGHLDIVVSDGSGSLKEGLELALGGAGIVVEDVPEGILLVCFIASFSGIDAAEGIFDQAGVVFSRRAWRVSM